MKKVIIGIHGLGNKPPKYLLKKWWKDAIKEGFNKNGFDSELPEFDLVYWADILYEKPLNKWDKNSPYYIDEPYKKSSKNFALEDHSFRQEIIDFVSTKLNKIFLNEDKTLNYSFISDFILEKFFKDLNTYYIEECKDESEETCKVKYLIRRRLIEVLNKYKGYEILIIAHSMGSIVAFDVLSFLLPETKIHTFVTMGSPLGLPVVVSKIASEHKKQPNGHKCMSTPPGVIKSWYNLADINDKIAINYRLNDDFGANENGVSPLDFLVVNDYEINKIKNPHKSFGYLRTHEMSIILNKFILARKKNFVNKVVDKLKQLVKNIKALAAFIKDRLNLN